MKFCRQLISSKLGLGPGIGVKLRTRLDTREEGCTSLSSGPYRGSVSRKHSLGGEAGESSELTWPVPFHMQGKEVIQFKQQFPARDKDQRS